MDRDEVSPERKETTGLCGVAAKFDGSWKDVENVIVVIQDGLLCGDGGQPLELQPTGGKSCSFKSGDQEWSGELQDDDTINWDDGEVWERTKPGSLTPKEVADEEKLRRKIEDFKRKRSELARAQGEMGQSEELLQNRSERLQNLRGGRGLQEAALAGRAPGGAGAPAAAGSAAYEEAKARSQAGIDKAKQAREEEMARRRAALERARAAKAQQQSNLQQSEEASRPGAHADEEGTARPRSAFQAAQQRAKMESSPERRTASPTEARSRRQVEGSSQEGDFEEAKRKSEAGIERTRKAFEEEMAKKFEALKKARSKNAGKAENEPPQGTAFPNKRPVDLPEEFTVGKYVKIKGLSGQPELNGQIATLVKYMPDKDRWQARIPGRPSILVRAENMEQATAEEKANAGRSPGPSSRSKGVGKGAGKDNSQCVVQIAPGEDGNHFDVFFSEEKSLHTALEKIVDTLARRGVTTIEANAPPALINAAYSEALALWSAGEFGPAVGHLEGRPEAQLWHDVLFPNDEKVFWIREELKGPKNTDSLKALSANMWDLSRLLAEELLHQMGISYTNFWSAMLVCYSGDKSYHLHLDNPSGCEDGINIPDNGLRLSLCYFINPHWTPQQPIVTSCGGGIDVHLTEPWDTPPLAEARKAPVIRVAPHADTLVVLLSQRMAHRVISTQGNSKWFALWVWCYDEEVKSRFDAHAADMVRDVH